jgi:hypothetical protein
LFQIERSETRGRTCALASLSGGAMDGRLKSWKLAVDELWVEPALDYAQAARLIADIAGSADQHLRDTAAQALPSLRHATLKNADRAAKALARRRLGAVRDALHALDAPRFGKRAAVVTPQDHYRRLLGLPLGRRLFAPEISEAYKRAAKKLHPDAGGSEREFQELSRARDALMRES